MTSDSSGGSITTLGNESVTGTYVLRLLVRQSLQVTFGRFQGGRPVVVPSGVCLYVGSAMGRRGAATLARRLVRHATRSEGFPPHPVRPEILQTLTGASKLLPQRPKTCHWHIDYLLDRPEVSLNHILILHSEQRLESQVAALLNADRQTTPLAPGLGASDAPGTTHLLRGPVDLAWWATLPARLLPLFNLP